MRSSMGVRLKLFVISLSLILLVILISGLFLERELRTWYEDRTEQALTTQALTVREAVREFESPLEGRSLQKLAERLGESSSARVTLIRSDGTVVADSELAPPELVRAENHLNRPEVQKALSGEVGSARRLSATIEERMQYVALPLREGAEPDLVVRVAMPLDALSVAIDRLQWFMVLSGLLGLVVAIGLSLAASHLMSRALRRLVDSARDLSTGQETRIEIASTDELGRLAGSFNRLYEELQGTLRTLATERGRFEAVLQSMSEAVLVLDSAQRIIMVNPAVRSLLGLRDKPVGLPLLDAVDMPELEALAKEGMEGAASAELALGGLVGRRVMARAMPLQATGGTVIAMHDVTEMRRLETIRKDFVANVSHELRTPVSIIRANAETLLDGALDDPERARSFVEALHRNSERLSRIISDLLDLSRVEAGRYQFEMVAVPLDHAVDRAAEAVEPKADDRNVAIELSVPAGLAAWADAKALDQILLNLLDNSIKYTPEGGHVAVRVEERAGQIRLEVQDDGPGIKPEHRARIFERFYRIDPGRSRDMGGTGLGLAIVKHFVESMGGRVGVEPAFPRGSIFWVTLPVADDDTPETTFETSAAAV